MLFSTCSAPGTVIGTGDIVFDKHGCFWDPTVYNSRLYVINFIKEEYQNTARLVRKGHIHPGNFKEEVYLREKLGI